MKTEAVYEKEQTFEEWFENLPIEDKREYFEDNSDIIDSLEYSEYYY